MSCAAWTLRLVSLAFSLFLITACGDVTEGVGDQGRLEFALATDYEVSGDLDEVKLIAGHPQDISVDATSRGEDDIAQPEEITYRFDPDDGVKITSERSPVGKAPDFTVTVEKAGTYKLRAIYKGKEVDSLTLRFDVPKRLDLSIRVRAPSKEEFKEITTDTTTTVKEGAQVLFVPIPLDARGDRLVGNLVTEAIVSSPELVVPGQVVIKAYEDGLWTVSGNVEFYFIDPGLLTITIKDSVNGAEGEHSFNVENVGAM